MIVPQAAQEPGGIVAILGWLIVAVSPVLIIWGFWHQRRERTRALSEPSSTLDDSVEKPVEPPLSTDDTMLPEPPEETDWYYSKLNQECGPVTEDELKSLAESGEFSEEDYLWHAGWTTWRRAETLPWLFEGRPPEVGPPPVPSAPPAERVPAKPPPKCATHAAVDAVHPCAYCSKPICATCTFEFPGDLFLCPDCAVKPPDILTPKRKKHLIASYLCAGFTTLLIGLMFTPAFWGLAETEADIEALGSFLFLLMLAGVIVGIITGAMAKGKHGRGALILGPWIWNIVLLAVLILLVVIGLTMG